MWGDTMSTWGDEYIGTSGGYHEYIGGYHEYIEGCSVHRRMFSTSEFSIEIEKILSLRCTEHPPMYS